MSASSTINILSNPLNFVIRSTVQDDSIDGLLETTDHLDLRELNQRNLAMMHITKQWTDFSTFDISILKQIDKELISPIIQYQLITQDALLYNTLSIIHFKLLNIKTIHKDTFEYKALLSHFEDIATLIIINKLLLKYFVQCKPTTSKLFLSILTNILLDKFNVLDANSYTHHLRLNLFILVETAVYWKKEHFEHMIQNDLCQVIKKYITKLHSRTQIKFVFCGVDNGMEVKNFINNLIHIVRCHANVLYCNNPNDQILKLYDLKLEQAFQTNQYNKKIKFLKWAYIMPGFYKNVKSEWINGVTFSMYKNRRISICGWILCNKSDKNEGKLYKCKGCKLILYCCKNHQKKHWKHIHSQLCLRN